MKRIILVAAIVLLPSLASAQITTYVPRFGGGGTLYQYGRRPSITTTLPNAYGGFTQYNYGPGRGPAFVQPLPTYGYGGYAPQPYYYQPAPVYRPWGYGYGMGSW